MCGITGIFDLSGSPVGDVVTRMMTDALAHRGPDGSGIFTELEVSLGHRRLAILDTSDKGSQPMGSHCGRWVVVFNGCIYNFREIRLELQAKGHVFHSTTDTEIISEGLSAYGPGVFERFDGMFAIAAWDRKNRELWLSRDRYGVKPLYYTYVGKQFLFSSEIKSFLQHPGFRVEVDVNALNEYFTFQNLFSFRTLFKNVALIPPANTIRISTASPQVHHNAWWDYNFSQTDDRLSFEDSVAETKRLFENAVTRQMISDVPVGSYLSGGMDSGSVAAIAGSKVPRLYTFTCGFDMSSVTGVEANYDERRDAELMASYFKTEHYEQVINAGDIKWSLPKVVWHLEDLKVGMSYPNYYISRLASKFVKVCLQGTGGDELFGGYPWRYYRVFNSIGKRDFFEQYYQFWQRLVPDESRKSLFSEDVTRQIDFAEPRSIFEKVFLFNGELQYSTPEDHVANSLYFEIKTFLPGLLMVGDKLSMANGLEERFPFLDNALVEFAQKVPVKHKLANLELMKKIDENEPNKRKMYRSFTDGKTVLRQAMQGYIPEQIINREKQGFSAPDESWYRGENANYVKELLLNKKTISAEFINPEFVRNIINEHIDKHVNHRLQIWSFMCFEWWCRIFLNGEKAY